MLEVGTLKKLAKVKHNCPIYKVGGLLWSFDALHTNFISESNLKNLASSLQLQFPDVIISSFKIRVEMQKYLEVKLKILFV